MNLEDCKKLLAHAEWADSLIWKESLVLAAENVELQEKLHHIHMVQWAYLNIWRGDEFVLRELSSFAGAEAVYAWARDYYSELGLYLSSVDERELSRELVFPWADRLVERFGVAGPVTWAESVLQIALHTSHHRGQVATRLRELGGESPLVDFVAWIWMKKPSTDWGDRESSGGS